MLILWSVSASIPIAVAEPAASLPSLGSQADSQVLRGRFVQHKHLADLDQALVSRGHYTVAQNRGLLWQVEQPVRSTLLITPDALTEHSQGQQTAHISADQQPALSAVASVLLAVFRGNTEQLSRYFDIQPSRQADDAGHTLVLTPKTEAVKNFIAGLKLTDDEHGIRRIRIDQAGGDYSVIDLAPSLGGSAELTPDERRAFSR
ncbi:outer membrane lipoprotein carrier protein LolA [Salinisphaera sp. SPP-AMP-43]|uniref:outer membrane lipoprotein carrier protein LolA n=1 Tax=Salinisphaera sp. SPP-AMP-43 TaxID=3121288 RepID=UPI003C6E4D62